MGGAKQYERSLCLLFATMSESIELVRRVVGRSGRITYEVRDAFGRFKPVFGGYDNALDLARRNIPADLEGGLYDADEVVEFSANDNYDGDLETIELDEIELDSAGGEILSEATPLIGGSAAVPLSNVPTAAIGAGIVGAGVAVGTVAGVLSQPEEDDDNGHVKPVISIDPRHNYIGPGNTVDTGAEPIDEDDMIAMDHDDRYEHAIHQEDVQEADRDGADLFLHDAIHNRNPHSAIGYIGLKAKEKIEGVIGVQYPPNLPTRPPAGMSWGTVRILQSSQ